MENEALIGNSLVFLGILIIFTGFLILAVGNFFETQSTRGQSRHSERSDPFEKRGTSENSSSPKVRGGGVIMLGPIPIVFGSDGESAKSAIILAIILTILVLLMSKALVFQ